MAEFPALPLWTDALIADTLELDPDEFGCYMLMLILAWRRPDCALPADLRLIKRMLQNCFVAHGNQLNRLIPKILTRYWIKMDGKYTQKRLTKERDFLRKRSEKNRNNANIRWNNNDLQMQSHCDGNTPTPTPTPTPIKKESKKNGFSDSSTIIPRTLPPPSIESPSRLPMKYKFEGKVVRLTEADFDQWEKAFKDLNLRAELVARDAWLAGDATADDRKRWFISTSKYLANRDAEERAKKPNGHRGPNYRYGII